MSFLPVVTRELRARAQSPAGHWGRVGAVTLALLVCLPVLVGSPQTSPAVTGQFAFTALTGAAFLLCCAACFLTSDTLSGERREGTLLLLLLTRISRWDVLMGKLLSSGFSAAAGLLALLPVIAIPMLMGGTSGPEVARHAAALANTMFLALTVGLCVSSVGLHRFRTTCGACLIMVAVVLVPLLPGLGGRLASPLGTMLEATDTAYRASPRPFWLSIAIVQSIGWALLGGAVLGLRRPAQEPDITSGSEPLGVYTGQPVPSHGVEEFSEIQCRYCGRKNSPDSVRCRECGTELFPKPPPRTTWTLASAPSPLHWLLRRERGLEPMLWVAAILVSCQSLVQVFGLRFLPVNASGGIFAFLTFVNVFVLLIAGLIVSSAATRFVNDARRDGTLELLLTTPLGAAELVSTQWDLVRRMITLPLLLMLAPSLGRVFTELPAISSPSANGGLWTFGYLLSSLLVIVSTIVSVVALCWVALWFVFGGMGKGRAMVQTVGLVNLVPITASYVWYLLVVFLGVGRSQVLSLFMHALVPQFVTIGYHLFLIRTARKGLSGGRFGADTFSLRPSLREGWAEFMAAVRRARRWPG